MQLTLEQRRDQWIGEDDAEFKRHHEFRLAQARKTWPLYLQWCTETAQTSRRLFFQWLTGESDPPTRLYTALNAGRALISGLDFDYGLTDLALVGQALDRHTVEEISQMPDDRRIQLCKEEREQRKKDGLISVPASDIKGIKEVVKQVSESETLSEAEAFSLVVQAFSTLSPILQKATLESVKSGEPLEDGTRKALQQALNPHSWLSNQKCFVPDCNMPAEELHHLKLGSDTRFRSQDVLCPLCRRHHQASLSRGAAHEHHQSDWIQKFWPSEAEFWMDLAALYANGMLREL